MPGGVQRLLAGLQVQRQLGMLPRRQQQAALEEKIEELEQKILLNSRDFVKLNELTKEKEATEAALEEKMERWEYLEDLAARIAAGE